MLQWQKYVYFVHVIQYFASVGKHRLVQNKPESLSSTFLRFLCWNGTKASTPLLSLGCVLTQLFGGEGGGIALVTKLGNSVTTNSGL